MQEDNQRKVNKKNEEEDKFDYIKKNKMQNREALLKGLIAAQATPVFLKNFKILSTLVFLGYIIFSIIEYTITISQLSDVLINVEVIDFGWRRISEFTYVTTSIRTLLFIQE